MEEKRLQSKGNGYGNHKEQSVPRKGKSRRYIDVPVAEEEAESGIVFGRNAVKELLSSGRDIDKIITAKGDRDGSITVLASLAIDRHIPVLEADRKKLDVLCGGTSHQGIAAMVPARNYCTVDEILAEAERRGEKPLIAIADDIEDPHNLGAIIRSAECAGFHGLIIPKRRSVGLTATVAKASAGATEHLLIAKVVNISSVIEELKEKGVWIYGADMDGSAYYDADLTG
ncbi:MAG: RNA methyltransferase, partial [Clostridia bacterium]|nr:RNA methyltransferase [Clostridia bacterium]